MENTFYNKFNWPIFCDEHYKLGYIPVPKAANTSILNAIFHLKSKQERNKILSSIPESKIIIDPNDSAAVHLYSTYMYDKIINKNTPNNYFIFSCVRNPYSRFLSFYKDKILRWDPFIEEKMKSIGFYFNMPFNECLENLVSIKDYSTLDQHIIPMTYLLYWDGKLLADLILKVETLKSTWSNFSAKFNQSTFILRNDNKGKSLENEITLTQEQREKIYNYYKDDFLAFGYEK